MWVEFGTGRSHRYIPVHVLAQSVGSQKCHTLPLCHPLTVCDTTSAFYGIGKRTAWAACSWDAQLTDILSELTRRFILMEETSTVSTWKSLKKITVSMYIKTSKTSRVNVARQKLYFTRKPNS